MLGAGIGAEMDVLTHHSEVDARTAAAWVNLPVAAYLATLWVIRDRFAPLGWRSHVLLLVALVFVICAWAGVASWVSAVVAVAGLLARAPITLQTAHKERKLI